MSLLLHADARTLHRRQSINSAIRNPKSTIIAIGISLSLQSPDPWPALDHASQIYQTITSLSADFVQVITNPMIGTPDTTHGRLYQMRPSRFAMRFTDPKGDRIVADGRFLWLYTPSTTPGQVIRSRIPEHGTTGPNLIGQFVEQPRQHLVQPHVIRRQRGEVASVELLIDPGDATGEGSERLLLFEIFERSLHQWAQGMPRVRVGQAGVPQESLGHRLDHHEVVRREDGARVIDRLGVRREAKRAHPEILRQALGRLRGAGHALDRDPGALQPFRGALRLRNGLEWVERSQGGTGPHERRERLLPLGPGQVQHHLLRAYGAGARQYGGKRRNRVVAYRENDDARLGDPGGRLSLRAHGEGERLGHGLLAAPVQSDVEALGGERERQSHAGAARPDDPEHRDRDGPGAATHASSGSCRPVAPSRGRGGPEASWRGAPERARPAPAGPHPAVAAPRPGGRTRSVRSRSPSPAR